MEWLLKLVEINQSQTVQDQVAILQQSIRTLDGWIIVIEIQTALLSALWLWLFWRIDKTLKKMTTSDKTKLG